MQNLLEMCERELELSSIQLKTKVYKITKNMWVPFKNGNPSGGWMRWWKRHHPELILYSSQAVEAAKASGLCQENVSSFYDSLEEFYSMHEYPPKSI